MRAACCLACLFVLALALPGGVGGTEPSVPRQVEAIRRIVDHRYRAARGRPLAVVDSSSTGVVVSLTLLDDAGIRSVPARNGVYFTLCSPGATCPFPRAASAWRVEALRPRRAAFELAVRTFAATTADLVVVALPTRTPVLVVLERERLRASLDPAFAVAASGDPSHADTRVRCVVDENTLASLYVPMGLESVSDVDDTFLAGRLTVQPPLEDGACPELPEGGS